MPKVILENIRSFSGRHVIDLKPLTFLVGENSSGKSTFLGAAACILTSDLLPGPKGLNSAPYEMGGFNAIATFRGGKAGRKKFFGLGVEISENLAANAANGFYLQYESYQGRTVAKCYELTTSAGKLTMEFAKSGFKGRFSNVVSLGDTVIDFESPIDVEEINVTSLSSVIVQAILSKHQDLMSKINVPEFFGLLFQLHKQFQSPGCSIAPIRTKPRRNYDSDIADFEPDGGHVPYLMAKVMLHNKGSQQSIDLRKALQKFGAESGLFSDLFPVPTGSRDGAPFQIQVTLEGPPRNLTDVGYGVSQSLPIVAQLATLKAEKFIFIQQPEVHLHPRAQSALGSLFGSLAAASERIFLVETHSDYVIDRVRQEVAAGVISSANVQILYFEVSHQKTTIHKIELDKMGNLVGAPPGYRSFFLEERRKLLSRGERNVPDSG